MTCELPLHELSLALSIVLTAFSQVLLRLGAKNKAKIASAVLNLRTILGYALFLIVVLLMIYAMQEIPLRTATAWNSATYIITPLAAGWFAKDPLNARMFFGSSFIVLGIVVFSL